MRNYVIGSVVGHVVVVLLGHWISLSSEVSMPDLETVRVSLAQLPEQAPPEVPEPPPLPADPEEVAYEAPQAQPETTPDVAAEPEPDLVPPEPDLPPEPEPEPEPEPPEPDPIVPDELPEPEPVVPVKEPEPAESAEPRTETPLEAVTPEASVQMSAPEGVDDHYLAMVQRTIGRRWEPTAAMARGRRDVKTVVGFRIGPAGEVMFAEVVTSSGLSVFDRQALRAVLSANPVPKPPPRFARSGLNIRFTFIYNP